MRYLTDRKRAVGKGASHTGTAHHWSMQLSAVGLAFLVPSWIYVFGSTLGKSHDAVLAVFSQPFPAILTGLVIFVGMRHFAKGASMMIEDYAKGTARKMLIIFVTSVSYVITATGLFALVKIAI
jgi:succinate dehydrogenase / fumarate reductase, membrane anchor subunit